MTEQGALRAADAYCRYLAGRHYENFTVASRVLPPAIRLHLARLYAYCRTTDDLGDESSDRALDRLADWQAQVEQCFDAGREPIHPVLLTLRRTIVACRLPREPFLDLIAANVQDQTVSSYGTWEDLLGYCQLSAAPVGRLVLRIWNTYSLAAERLSDDVCIGLQLANFAQDVAVDRGKGRTYLVATDLEMGTAAAVRAMCDRAEQLLDSGKALETMVPGRLRLQLALYRLGGMAVIGAIRRTEYRTDRQRPRVSAAGKLAILGRACLQSGRSEGRVTTGSPV
jgi:squalene synthase HpnC